MEKPAICGGEPVRSTKIFYGHQFIDEDDIQAVVDVLKSDYLTCGPKIGELEEKLCEVTGAKYAVVCSNGTAALHIACLAAGVMPGDEVITTPITFAASANCALYCGAKPVFADINENTYNIDPAHVEKLTTERTKAVVAVDFTGQSVELDRLLTHCREHNLVLIEDGAHVIGTSYKGRMNGSIADMTTMSFHPVKTVTGGEGGAVLTNSKEYYEKLLLYRAHGITRDPKLMEHEPDGPWYYEQIALGMNYRMDTVNSFCGNIDSTLEAKGHICSPKVIVDRLRKCDHIESLFPKKVCCLMGAVSSKDNQTVKTQLIVILLHGFYLVDAVLIRLPDGLERNS